MADVVALVSTWKTPEENKEALLELLRDLVAKAESGEIDAIAFVTIDPAGFTRCVCRRGPHKTATLAGRVAAVQFDIQMDWQSS